jgi:hypothetical protein
MLLNNQWIPVTPIRGLRCCAVRFLNAGTKASGSGLVALVLVSACFDSLGISFVFGSS